MHYDAEIHRSSCAGMMVVTEDVDDIATHQVLEVHHVASFRQDSGVGVRGALNRRWKGPGLFFQIGDVVKFHLGRHGMQLSASGDAARFRFTYTGQSRRDSWYTVAVCGMAEGKTLSAGVQRCVQHIWPRIRLSIARPWLRRTPHSCAGSTHQHTVPWA